MNFLSLPSFPVARIKSIALLAQWINDRVIQLLEIDSLLIAEDIKHPKYCPYHRRGCTILTSAILYEEYLMIDIELVRSLLKMEMPI